MGVATDCLPRGDRKCQLSSVDPQIEAQIAEQRLREQDYHAWASAQPRSGARSYAAAPLAGAHQHDRQGLNPAHRPRVPAVCAAVPAGHAECGVAALGRCIDCARPFCLSHQGNASDGGTFTNLCSTCLLQREQAVAATRQQVRDQAVAPAAARAQQARNDLDTAKKRIRDIAQRLVAAGSPGLAPRFRVVGQKQTIPGWTKWRDVTERMSPAWQVGEFEWVVHHAARCGTFECDAYDQNVDRTTFVLPSGEIVAQAPASYGFGGAPRELADLKAWQDVAAAFEALAARLDHR